MDDAEDPQVQKTVEYATGSCDSVQKTVYVRPVQDMDMIVDFPLVLQHQVQKILTMQRQRRFLRASSLIVEDMPEMGQRQDQTEKIHKTAAQTQGQIAETFSDHSEDPEVCRGTTSCSETDRPEIQKTVKIPQQTQRGQSPEGQTRPSEVRALRARQDPT